MKINSNISYKFLSKKEFHDKSYCAFENKRDDTL